MGQQPPLQKKKHQQPKISWILKYFDPSSTSVSLCVLLFFYYYYFSSRPTAFCGGNGTEIIPGQVGELGVDRAGDHLGINGMELMHTIAERNDLGGADKCAADRRATRRLLRCRRNAATQLKQLWRDVRSRCYSQVQGIEEKDDVFASVVWQLQLLEFPVNDSRSLPLWCRLWNWSGR